VTEWLDLMLDEVRRKNSEEAESVAEAKRRAAEHGRKGPGTAPVKRKKSSAKRK
jgi:hypothetical protein